MKKLILIIFCISSLFVRAENINTWLKVEGLKTIKPILSNEKNVNNKTFNNSKMVLYNTHNIKTINPINGNTFLNIAKSPKWKIVKGTNDIIEAKLKSTNKYISYYATYVEVDAYTKGSINFKLYTPAEIFVDGKIMNKNYSTNRDEPTSKNISLKLTTGKHCVIVKTLSSKGNLFSAEFIKNKEFAHSNVTFTTSEKKGMNIYNIMHGVKPTYTSIAPEGQFALIGYSKFIEKTGKNEQWTEVVRIKDKNVVYSFRGSKAYNIKWLPNTNIFSWMMSNEDGKTIYKYDTNNNKIETIVDNLNKINNYYWASDHSYIIYSRSENHAIKGWKLKKLQGIEDRKPYFRNRISLYKYDLTTKQTSLLNWGNKSLNLQDISHDNKSIIVSNSYPTYTEYPYSKQNIYLVHLETMRVDTLWKDKKYGLSCSFSPDDKNLLIKAGGSAFGEIGLNIKKGQMANNYDSQLYIFNIKTNNVEAITRNFNPNIQSAKWFESGKIYISAQDKDYVRAFVYNTKNKEFKKVNLPGDYIKSLTFCNEGFVASYISCKIDAPYKVYLSILDKDTHIVISNPEKTNYQNVTFGKTDNWNFNMDNGDEIIGRYYLPRNFDASKKYPLLVYYYAGTSPVSRYFGGRYPFNLFAANGYVVYVLQPSGATGFGQEFAARHQNNWCKTTADEIIYGVKKFTKDHSFINKDKIACMGASYGGFTTEFLQTKTDIFACAIAHAGISSIASYWGEGYWGYQYSTEATGHSFPWNRKDIYVDQSALFNADKIKTPMLLLHGTADVNVPTGESIQFYTALKLLGIDVELVLLKDSDHIVYDYHQRILWNNTIVAYLDKYLKGQAQWWNDIYPDKNL